MRANWQHVRQHSEGTAAQCPLQHRDNGGIDGAEERNGGWREHTSHADISSNDARESHIFDSLLPDKEQQDNYAAQKRNRNNDQIELLTFHRRDAR